MITRRAGGSNTRIVGREGSLRVERDNGVGEIEFGGFFVGGEPGINQAEHVGGTAVEVLRQDGEDDGVRERVRYRCAQCRGLS
ncbi:MAG TPA: hypothetical protein QGG37_02940 [Chloroflexota bacterium]|nr:hypothetical protein [Chloroflexota bacterium]